MSESGRIEIEGSAIRIYDSAGYEIVMWDVLSGDFREKIDPVTCLEKTIKYTKNGSIVLFHDSVKTAQKLKVVLPRFLEHFSKLGYSFQGL